MVPTVFGTVNTLVLVYNKRENVYYGSAGEYWFEARPATLEDLKQYLYESA